MARQANQQNQETIETISQYEHIRLRASMYIGRLGDGTDPNDGIYNFIKEIVANSIHEFRKGYGNSIEIVIEDNVWLGNRVIILPGTHIGEGAIIQAGSVVVGEIPKYGIAGGHPAKVFKYRNAEHYEKLKKEGRFH